MKNLFLLITLTSIILFGCRTSSGPGEVLEDMQEELDLGNIKTVAAMADSLHKIKDSRKDILQVADSLADIAQRTGLEFSMTESGADSQIEKLIGEVSPGQKSEWEKKGWLEWRMINGEKKYFNRAVTNLILLIKFHEKKAERSGETAGDQQKVLRLGNTSQIIRETGNESKPVVPVKMKITYTLTVHKDAVPEGKIIRCWLPWPKTEPPRQDSVVLISTSNPEYIISPDSAIHSTLYMEERANKGEPVIFQISYSYISLGQHFNISEIKDSPYDNSSLSYLKYTSEQLPHINFNDDVRHLADSITGNDSNTVSVVEKIYHWFKENIPWSGALEYSVIPDIPEYTIKNMRGDCGMQTFLIISILRYKGIPVKWQSGWMMPPGGQNLHDWSEVYYEGTGWVPVDISYDLQKSDDESVKNFYLSGIDSYRLIVNNGIAGPLHPQKHFMRSEPYDFQRGEVEWEGGNLYFDKWDYNMQIELIK